MNKTSMASLRNSQTRMLLPRFVRTIHIAAIVLGILCLLAWKFLLLDQRLPSDATRLLASNEILEHKIDLEAHIMSKCPDARDCLLHQIIPVMENLSPHINFTLSFIGQPTDPDDGVSCKHGPSECLGNILELCASEIYASSPKIWLGFVGCLSREFWHIPERNLVQRCAADHAVDFEKLNECASKDNGAYGVGLLRQSVLRSRDVGATYSCTVRLDEKIRCVRDGGEWRDCPGGASAEELKREIKKLWKARND